MQPFQYLALSIFSFCMLAKIHFSQDKIFRIDGMRGKCDFSIAGTVISLIVFEQTTFIFTYVYFFNQGKASRTMSVKKLIAKKKEWFIAFSDDVEIKRDTGKPLIEVTKISNFMLCLSLLLLSYILILIGFYTKQWAFILTGIFL